MTQHRQVQASRAIVDEGMVDLLEAVWASSMDTEFSCQGGPDEDRRRKHPHPGYIVFPAVDDGVRFLEMTAKVLEPYEYERIAMRLAATPSPGEDVVAGGFDDTSPPRAYIRWPHTLTPILNVAWTDSSCRCGDTFSQHSWRCSCGGTQWITSARTPTDIDYNISCWACTAKRTQWPTCCQHCGCTGFTR